MFAALLLLVASGASCWAADFPRLSGRIVDAANIIPAGARTSIEPKLSSLEEKSGIQLVVATVSSLGGQAIEPYANELFRAWKLGEKQKNNGVLLLIAPNERKLRIEVGYGLEGTLTDALSKIIIANAIAPRFKAGDFGGGIERGVDDIITVLTTDAAEWQKRPQLRAEDQSSAMDTFVVLFVIAIFVIVFISILRDARRGPAGRIARRGGNTIFIPSSGGSNWSSGSSWGGGFSGGGGSSGGGGASGDW